MPAYDIQQLDVTLTAAGYDQNTRAQVENFLVSQGYFTAGNPTVDLENAQGPNANLLVITGQGTPITVDSTANLSYILDPALASLTVDNSGPQTIGVSLTTGNESVALQGAGDILIYGGSGNDTIDAAGSTGNDSIYGGSGTDALIGGPGADLLLAGTGGGTLQSGSLSGGYNVLTDYTGAAHTLTGGEGNDYLYQEGSGNDSLVAGSGNQSLYAQGTGSDTLTASGTTGQDTLYAFSGTDSLVGGTGADLLIAYGGTGTMTSGSENSSQYNVLDDASAGPWTMQGGAGQDLLYAVGTGADSLIAGGGDNSLYAMGTSSAVDTLTAAGTTGQDTLVGVSGDYAMTGGRGADLLMAFGGTGTMTSGTENGSQYNVLIDYSDQAHTLQGAAGQDQLYADGSGNDVLKSGTGGNLLDAQGSTGNNDLVATAGNNTLDAGAGQDTLDASGSSGSTLFYSGTGAAETMLGSSGQNFFDMLHDVAGQTVDITGQGNPANNAASFVDEGKSFTDATTFNTVGNTTTVGFGDGQTVTLTDVQTIYFTDGAKTV